VECKEWNGIEMKNRVEWEMRRRRKDGIHQCTMQLFHIENSHTDLG